MMIQKNQKSKKKKKQYCKPQDHGKNLIEREYMMILK